MPTHPLAARWSFLGVVVACLVGGSAVAQPTTTDGDIDRLVERLDAATAADRDAAEAELVRRGSNRPRATLAGLPAVDPAMPPAMATALGRVRVAIEQQLAIEALAPSRVTLNLQDAPLAAALEAFSLQTGNSLVDQRAAFGAAAPPTRVSLSVEDEPFWPAVDRLLDATNLTVYPYGGEELRLVERDANAAARSGAGCYAGPLRLEVERVAATRERRQPPRSQLVVTVEVQWEPRLRPILVSQSLASLQATLDTGEALRPKTRAESIDLEVSPGTQALALNLAYELPTRDAQRIERIEGELVTIVPAERREFRIESIVQAKLPQTQTFGDATVTVDRFRKENAIWELQMRLRLDGAGDALASHRGWVAQNPAYLVDPKGRRIEYAGLETTLQTEDEVGFAYLFDLSGGMVYGFGSEDDAIAADGSDEPDELDPAELTWVYETPTGVYTAPFKWSVGPIDLP